MKWYTVYTKPQVEKKVIEQLARKKIESYCPINKFVDKRSDKKIKEEPLFKSYVFVKGDSKTLLEIKKVSGILNLVYWLGKPVVVSNKEIENIKEFLDEHNNVIVEKTVVGQEDCSESYQKSIFHSHEDDYSISTEMVSLIIPSLGYVMCAEISKPRVRIISSESFLKKSKFTPYKLFNKVVELNSVIRSNW